MPTMSEEDYDNGMLKWTGDFHKNSVLHKEQQATKESWDRERWFPKGRPHQVFNSKWPP